VKVFGDFAILQPETRLAIDGETEKSIELVGHVDAKRLKHLLIEFTRPFQVRDGEIDMVNHGLPPFVSLLQPRGAAHAILLKSFYLLPPFAKMISPVSQPASSEAAPSAPKAFAMPAPIPFEAPVTIATLLSSRFMAPPHSSSAMQAINSARRSLDIRLEWHRSHWGMDQSSVSASSSARKSTNTATLLGRRRDAGRTTLIGRTELWRLTSDGWMARI